ncbi:MAG: Asp-tRNA(Asn)/Glu-tRNA(Gln) amidotransferase subunit GatC [Holosporales bacterium]|jgi:aspartyl/glutamyl-tRNA(Asn/Gln) amidotransferase C subunit|nr:Asp-tRNA(Asn)/Glu-tRNA(Gln) amidotransferase subunit GatC [Holosporales bacterium]
MLQKEDLKKICGLAKIKIDIKDENEFLEKLNTVFTWIEQLSKIDVSNISNLDATEPTLERQDIPIMTNSRAKLLSNSKYKKFDMFSVPKVVE